MNFRNMPDHLFITLETFEYSFELWYGGIGYKFVGLG